MNQPTYSGFERDVFRTVADYFLNLPEPLLTFEYYELFLNILGMYEHRNKLSVSCKFIYLGEKKNLYLKVDLDLWQLESEEYHQCCCSVLQY